MFQRYSPQSISLCDLPISKTEEIMKDIALQRRSSGPFKPLPPNNNNKTTQVWNSLKDFFNPKKGRAITHSCLAEYQKLKKDPSPARLQTQMQKRASSGMSGRSSGSRPKCLLMLGSVRPPPPKMEMSDIRIRQRRRIRASVVPEAAGGGEGGKRKFKFLSALTCRGHEEVEPLELQVARFWVS
ncbi:hypothetical protein AAC387_Pa05g2431 [Persea americana]